MRNRASRRDFLRLAGLGLAGFALPEIAFPPADAAEAPRELQPLNRFPRMVQEYFVEQVRAAERAGLKAKNALKTKADAEAYVQEVRRKIRACFGPFPEKTPLNARVTGTVDRKEYKIEKVIFESRPNFLVTANLYLPKRKGPLPGVVGSCGHSDNGKAAEAYQSFSQGLAKLGYVVLIFDPIGQGERLQYADEKLHSTVGVGVREHLLAGNQQFLVGEFFGAWRAWDGIRALDYLLSRPEVDPKHVGITGNSGGGTMTTWLCGVEDRWTMAAPGCFVTTFLRNMENELPADTEQCPPRVLALGLDHDDFLAALAPKPIIILAKEKDFFDARGAEEAYARLKRLYKLLGAEDKIALEMGPTAHGYSKEIREAMYRWFNQATHVSDARTEPEIEVEKDQTLWCTPDGQIAKLKPRTVFSFTEERSQALTKRRAKIEDGALARLLTESLKLPAREGVPEYRILRPRGGRKYPKGAATAYAVDTEPGIHALVYRVTEKVHLSRPAKGPKRAVLYVSHHSSDAELREEPFVAELLKAEPDVAFYTCDVRGIGESRPDTCGIDTFRSPYGSDYFYAIHAIMLDRPYVGQKTHDVLRVLDWLKSHGHAEIHLAALGWGTLPATFAAVLSDLVTQVTLKGAPPSYSAIAETEHYHWPLSTFVPGVLEKFDLPDCYRLLEAKKLKQVEVGKA
jgi:dienelactone hydrolase